MSTYLKRKVVVIGIGGASCSGKTLLAKHIRRALPKDSAIIHQDDFCPPEDKVPYSKQYPDLQDWDDPEHCIQWPQFRDILRHVRQTGHVGDHDSHDHLNKQNKVEVDEEIFEKWSRAFVGLDNEHRAQGVELIWVIVDGFVLYYDTDVVDMLDVRIFLRVPRDTLRTRRENRQVYVLQHPADAEEGGVWVDPPEYFDKIVWPGYVKSHERVFDDVEAGQAKPEWGAQGTDLHVVSPSDGSVGMTEAFDQSCESIIADIKKGKGVMIP